jgi:gliding motility-associated protein GldM
MGIPKEPRQQMINMMYLFLTAMLALNVSAEILRAFSIVNKSLEETAGTISDKNEVIMMQFQKKLQEDPDKTREFYDRAELVVKKSSELSEFISEIKTLLIDNAGNKNGKVDPDDYEEEREPGVPRVKNESNLDMSSQLLLVEKGGKRGKDLKAKINEIRTTLIGIVSEGMSPEEKENYDKSFPLSPAEDNVIDGIPKPWQVSNFADVPLAAAITLLTKYETDVKNAEAEILSYLINSISAADFKFDVIKPIVRFAWKRNWT